MNIGSQLVCTNSVGSLHVNNEYYFAGLRPCRSALLARFYKSGTTWKVQTLTVAGDDFDRYLQKGLLERREPQRTLPVWLADVEGINFEEIESLRYSSKKHRKYVVVTQQRF